jgi:biotin operon repressor
VEADLVSQNSRILAVLADGKPHSTRTIHALAGYSRLNSRIAELRSRGYVIECFHVPGKTGSDGYGYTLVSEPARSTQASSPRLTAGSSEESGAASTPIEACSGQLSLSVAA